MAKNPRLRRYSVDCRIRTENIPVDGLFSKYFCSELYSDMAFVVGRDGVRVPGHKFILSDRRWGFSKGLNHKCDIVIENVECDTFLRFLEYCYKGRINHLHDADAMGILRLAYQFDVKDLVRICEVHLCKNVNVYTCFNFYRNGAFLVDSSVLKQTLLNCIAANFACLIEIKEISEDFVNLPLKAIEEFVEMETLDCDEMELFHILTMWAKYNCLKEKIPCNATNLRLILDDVFMKIRFPIMKSEWIHEILTKYPGLLTNTDMKGIEDILTNSGTLTSFSIEKVFNHTFRQFGLAHLRNSTKFINLPGKLVASFQSLTTMADYATNKMYLAFQCEELKVLLGFGIFAKKTDSIECEFCNLDHELANIEISIEQCERFSLSWDYDLVLMIFNEAQLIEPLQWFSLYCVLDEDSKSSILEQCRPLKTNEEHKVSFSTSNNVAFVPYLIFQTE